MLLHVIHALFTILENNYKVIKDHLTFFVNKTPKIIVFKFLNATSVDFEYQKDNIKESYDIVPLTA